MKAILKISILCLLMSGIVISLDNEITSAQLFPGYGAGIQVVNAE